MGREFQREVTEKALYPQVRSLVLGVLSVVVSVDLFIYIQTYTHSLKVNI